MLHTFKRRKKSFNIYSVIAYVQIPTSLSLKIFLVETLMFKEWIELSWLNSRKFSSRQKLSGFSDPSWQQGYQSLFLPCLQSQVSYSQLCVVYLLVDWVLSDFLVFYSSIFLSFCRDKEKKKQCITHNKQS